jgi:prepilin-type N-terminal cleavage/methylation domain-containing protein
MRGERGFSLVEMLLVLGITLVLTTFAVPLTASVVDASRARQAATFAAVRLRFARQQAVARSASTGLVFDQIGSRWIIRICVDGNGNGLRRADLGSGKDTCPEGPLDVAVMFPGVQVAVDGTIQGPDGDAPSADPVRFGSSNLASFSPSGTCTGGSLFVRSAKGVQYAVRIAGVTGRLRILRYDTAARTWKET